MSLMIPEPAMIFTITERGGYAGALWITLPYVQLMHLNTARPMQATLCVSEQYRCTQNQGSWCLYVIKCERNTSDGRVNT